MPVVIVLLVLIILAELFLLMLRCRREHPGWKLLRQYRYAHRGYHDKPHIPENSMAAFRRAIEHGYGAELDVHLMKDGRLAVIHDASLKRTAGADVLVEDLTAEELKQYRLEGTQEQIPLLEEVLPLFQGKTPLIIELKAERGNHAQLAEATCAMLDRFRVNYCIESFDPRCILWLKKHRRKKWKLRSRRGTSSSSSASIRRCKPCESSQERPEVGGSRSCRGWRPVPPPTRSRRACSPSSNLTSRAAGCWISLPAPASWASRP